MDEQIITWAHKQPGDWEIEVPKYVFLWGSGSHGQLTDLGTAVHEPKTSTLVFPSETSDLWPELHVHHPG